MPPFPNGSEFVPRPRQDQYTVVVRNAPPQDGLKHVVDRDLVSLGDWPDVQPCDQATLADVHVLVFTKVLLDGNAEPGIGRDHQEDVEVKAAVAEDERGRPRILLVDLQIGSPDEERKIVGRSGPRLPMRPGDERRIDPLDFTVHRLDDCAARTRKLREREGDEMARPPVVHAVTDQLGVANHELPVDGIDTADPIVIVNFPVGFD